MEELALRYARYAAIAAAIFAVGVCVGVYAANAHDHEHPEFNAWYAALKQPDTIGLMGGGVSCCGTADAYWADEVHVRDGHVYAVITDDRPDGDLMRMHEEIGTEFEVPPNKIVGREQNLGNPTGHTVIFLGTAYWLNDNQRSKRPVLCYVMNGGV